MPFDEEPGPASGEDAWLDEVAGLEAAADLGRWLEGRPELHDVGHVERLAAEVARLTREDLPRARRIGEAARRLAEIVGEPLAGALSLKADGHLELAVGRYPEALDLYRACQRSFEEAGAEVEAAVNRGTVSLWMLALLGRYEEAWEDSRRARAVLERHGDPRLLARLTSTEGNIFLRQDRHHEALERYREALAMFRDGGEPQEVAVTLHNIAVSSIAIYDFPGALESYRELGVYCAEHQLTLLAVQADYNIAYLYFFRGEYTRALERYRETRRKCRDLGDVYHLALCDLDQAEIYLELNMGSDAGRLARRAFDAFEKRGQRYEAAKALAFMALAAGRAGDTGPALERFAEARDRFEAEGNRAWVAMVEIYRALILLRAGSASEAAGHAAAARDLFGRLDWPGRVALCDLVLARVELEEGRLDLARARCLQALAELERLDLPSRTLDALMILGRTEEARGELPAALAAYRRARATLEDLRTHLGSEESKIAFFQDKVEVYESLVAITLGDSPAAADLRTVLGYFEQAKSRGLADLVASGGSFLRPAPTDSAERAEEMKAVREELTYHRHELSRLYGLRAGEGDSDRAKIDALRRRRGECEARLQELMSELRSSGSQFAALQSAATVGIDRIEASLPADSSLLEYFISRGVVYAAVLRAGRLTIRAVAEAAEVSAMIASLRQQMSKFKLGEAYLGQFGKVTEAIVARLLASLYESLVEPVASELGGDHLVVVPHGALHQVPFHALPTDGGFLVDRFSFSYAPSASLHATLAGKPRREYRRPLVLGVADEGAPEILAEVQAVAGRLPGARLFTGEEASERRLRELGPESSIVHLATHGFFRQDNPMFSAVQLGTTRLTVHDLYGLELGADLVVLSGCSTGLSVVETGDELIGLTRGFFYAGADSLLVSLWDVSDRSTAAFMERFYGFLATEANRSAALARAMRELRTEYPSPYHWAPFVLMGRSRGDLVPVDSP